MCVDVTRDTLLLQCIVNDSVMDLGHVQYILLGYMT